MFTPTHLAHIRTVAGVQLVALQLMHVQSDLEVLRDCTGKEFHQWGCMGIADWGEYQIRKIASNEQVPKCAITAARVYKSPCLRAYDLLASEPSMITC